MYGIFKLHATLNVMAMSKEHGWGVESNGWLRGMRKGFQFSRFEKDGASCD